MCKVAVEMGRQLERAEVLLAQPKRPKEGVSEEEAQVALGELKAAVGAAKELPIPDHLAPFVMWGRQMAATEMQFLSAARSLERMLEVQAADLISAATAIARQS